MLCGPPIENRAIDIDLILERKASTLMKWLTTNVESFSDTCKPVISRIIMLPLIENVNTNRSFSFVISIKST